MYRYHFVCAQDKQIDTGITIHLILRFCLQIYLEKTFIKVHTVYIIRLFAVAVF